MAPRPVHSLEVLFAAVLLLAFPRSFVVFADTFGTGSSTFEIEFVTIGNPENSGDTQGWPYPAGSVSYTYRLGKHEISVDMIDKANAATAGTANPLQITIDRRDTNQPATSVSWIEAAKFINWLNTSSGYWPAYKFASSDGFALWEPSDAGYDPANLFRNSLAFYFLPSVDEWYKAAYYVPTIGQYARYPNGRLDPPIPVAGGTDPNTAVYLQTSVVGPPDVGPADIMLAGGLSPYGTMAQGGNVYEWQETEIDLSNDDPASYRAFRGGFWESSSVSLSSDARGRFLPTAESIGLGFRVGSIPEPCTTLSTVLSLIWLSALNRSRS